METRKSNLTEAPADRTLVLTRVFDAPRHLVFEAWTKKEHLDQWCAPHGFTIPHSKGDFRTGGAWESLMIRPDGEKFPVSGVYKEIVQDQLLVFTHGWIEDNGKRDYETTVTVRFESEGAKTKVTLEQAIFKSIESRDGHQGGWTECLERLADYLPKI